MTPMNSDRQLVQLEIEKVIGCTDPSELRENKKRFLNFKANHQNISKIQELLSLDAVSLFEKGCQSFIQGVNDLYLGFEAWSIIKLYYSTYYFLRCELALNGISIVRCPDICTLTTRVGEKPTLASKNFRKNDHKSTTKIFVDKLGRLDLLCSQEIDGSVSYEWLAGMREWANYRSRNFPEHTNKGYFCPNSVFSIDEQIHLYMNDTTPIYCFDTDYACLALPTKRAQITWENFHRKGLNVSNSYSSFIAQKMKNSPFLKELTFFPLFRH